MTQIISVGDLRDVPAFPECAIIAAMKQPPLEPGLLSIFRLFTGLRLGLLGLAAVGRLFVHDLPAHAYNSIIWFNFTNTAVLLAYLSWPALQRRLGRAYLPIGLALASAVPIVEQNLMLRAQITNGIEIPWFGHWQLLPLLFIPLVLIGWQYNFRSVLLFSLSTAALDWGLTVSAVDSTSVYILFPLFGTLFVRTVSFLLVGYMVVRLMKTQREQRRELAQANTQLVHYAATLEQLATSRERNRLARELHDTLAHSLSGVAVQLEAVKTLWDTSPEDARTMLEGSLAATRSGLTETRRALKALRASPLEDLGLGLAIRSLAESIASRNSLVLDLIIPDRLENLSPDVEQTLYRVAQEALENISKHAEARHVKLHLIQDEDHIELTVSDDGRGFEPYSLDRLDQFGLQGIRERTEMLGGDLDVESRPGQGTTIRLAWGEKT